MKRNRVLGALMMIGLAAGATSAVVKKPAPPGGKPMTASGVHEFRVTTIAGVEKSLADYRGKALLIVNTASRCGFTRQYKSLESLQRKYGERGFTVLAFPANNFMGQEPGTNEEILTFCTTRYGTSFPLFSKISVTGKDIAPLYRYLTHDSGFGGDIGWNFTKFLVGPDGKVVARFDSAIDPLDPKVTAKLDALLAAK